MMRNTGKTTQKIKTDLFYPNKKPCVLYLHPYPSLDLTTLSDHGEIFKNLIQDPYPSRISFWTCIEIHRRKNRLANMIEREYWTIIKEEESAEENIEKFICFVRELLAESVDVI